MSLDYQRFDCFSGSCTAIDPAPVHLTSGIHSTPPATEGGGSCNVDNVFPIPTGT